VVAPSLLEGPGGSPNNGDTVSGLPESWLPGSVKSSAGGVGPRAAPFLFLHPKEGSAVSKSFTFTSLPVIAFLVYRFSSKS